MLFYTKFSRKQINVLFALNKKGTLKIKKGTFSFLYRLVDTECDYDGMGTRRSANMYMKEILDAVFSKDYQKAQMHIDNMQDEFDSWIN